jgi:nardilysin
MGFLAPYDNEVVKSPMDKRLYKTVHLSNGLFALLVHDPEIYPDSNPLQSKGQDSVKEEEEGKENSQSTGQKGDEKEKEENGEINGDGSNGKEETRKTTASSPSTKKAAAAMCVRMGSFSDPPNAQGLAHFLEHMLFMGSSEFPDENEYASYLSKHGGSSNAFTEWEYTCYYFDINREFLVGALQRFSQFFISPLVKEDALEREVLAVDSEFNQVLQNDSCRLSQLQCHTSSPNHPVNKFSWGMVLEQSKIPFHV